MSHYAPKCTVVLMLQKNKLNSHLTKYLHKLFLIGICLTHKFLRHQGFESTFDVFRNSFLELEQESFKFTFDSSFIEEFQDKIFFLTCCICTSPDLSSHLTHMVHEWKKIEIGCNCSLNFQTCNLEHKKIVFKITS